MWQNWPFFFFFFFFWRKGVEKMGRRLIIKNPLHHFWNRGLDEEWRLFIIISRASKWGTNTLKRGKPEMHSSCRNSLDLHWSASARPGRGCASVPHLRYLSVSRHLMNRRHCARFWAFSDICSWDQISRRKEEHMACGIAYFSFNFVQKKKPVQLRWLGTLTALLW